MKFFRLLVLIVVTVCFTSCTVKERIVFNEDGSGSFLLNYDMAEFVNKIKEEMGGASSSTDGSKKAVDTIMVFSDIMETYKDSVAALPEEKRLALEAVKDMYMKMNMDEEKGVFNFGIGLDFKSFADLSGIGEKITKAQSLNSQSGQVDAMKGSPLGKFMGNDDNKTTYDYTETTFTRNTPLPKDWSPDAMKFDENDETDKQFMDYFKNANYTVEYTFPKKIKSYSVDSAELSNNDKTITYQVSWLDVLKNPKILDINLTFVNE